MEDATRLVDDINRKVRKLIERHNSLKDQYSDLIDKQKELSKTIEEQNKLIEKLNEQNAILKIAKSVKPEEGTVDVKKRIDILVREIDTCIGLLNN